MSADRFEKCYVQNATGRGMHGSGEELTRDELPTRECTPLAKAGKLT